MSARVSEAGFTLIEMLVAMAAGMVIMGAVVTILITTLDQTQVMSTRVAATRATSLALTNIENELHSACVGTGTAQNLAPVQSGSGSNQLNFVTFTGTTVNPTPYWHVLTYNATPHTLTDATYDVTGSAGSWAPTGAAVSTTTVLADVGTQTNAQGATIPFFQYFKYVPAPTANTDGEYDWVIPDGTSAYANGTVPTASPQSWPLTPATAASTAEVLITLVGYASTPGQGTSQTTGDPQTDQISLRLTDPPSEAPLSAAGSYGPCE